MENSHNTTDLSNQISTLTSQMVENAERMRQLEAKNSAMQTDENLEMQGWVECLTARMTQVNPMASLRLASPISDTTIRQRSGNKYTLVDYTC